MKNVLHLTSSGSQLWRKSRDGWQTSDGPPVGSVWVVTDLAEESFAEIQIPRIFGRDRQGFIARQLASRFPDTPYRTTLSPRPTGGLMDRLAPPRQTLVGLDAAQRVNSALDTLTAPVAGVWAMSMLLAQIGCKKTLPPELFVVLPAPDALRIVFIKNRIPVLSRLIPGVIEARDQAAEITRTLRHLENIRVLDRAERRHGVLLLSDAQDMASLLAPDRLDLLPAPPPWTTSSPSDWRFALFDLALTSPPGQLAPLARRTKYVATRLRPPAYAAAALSLILALWASVGNLRDISAYNAGSNQTQGNIQSLATRLSDVELKMAGFGVPAELVRRAVTLEREEITLAPSLATHMQQLGQIVAQDDAARLTQLEWRIVPTGQTVCALGAPRVAGNSEPPAVADTAEPKRVVEISFNVALAQEQPSRARAQSVAGLSAKLRELKGVTLVQDPGKGLELVTLSGGGTSPTPDKPLSWCLTLADQPIGNAPTTSAVKP